MSCEMFINRTSTRTQCCWEWRDNICFLPWRGQKWMIMSTFHHRRHDTLHTAPQVKVRLCQIMCNHAKVLRPNPPQDLSNHVAVNVELRFSLCKLFFCVELKFNIRLFVSQVALRRHQVHIHLTISQSENNLKTQNSSIEFSCEY